MKFGVLGFGNIARKFAKSIEYTTEGEIYAIASRSVDENDEYFKAHPDVRIYRDYTALLENQEIEAVYIALPHLYHKEWIIRALKHHKAVLSEKPIVLNSGDLDEIMEMVKTSDGYCLEAFKTKFNHGFHELKKDLSMIGQIKTIETNFCFDATQGRKDTYLFDKRQGGALNDLGSYVIGFILDIANSKINRIEAEIEVENDIEMCFQAKLYFQNGIIGHGEGSIKYDKERYALIKGTRGEIMIPVYNRVTEYTITTDDQCVTRHYPLTGDDMTCEIEAVIDDVRHHKHENEIHSLSDSKYLQQVIEMIRKEGTK